MGCTALPLPAPRDGHALGARTLMKPTRGVEQRSPEARRAGGTKMRPCSTPQSSESGEHQGTDPNETAESKSAASKNAICTMMLE